MALTRKFLTALGIESDKIDEIINAHLDTVNGLKDEKETLVKKYADYDDVKKELETLKGEGGQSYRKKYEETKNELDTLKAEVQKKLTRSKKEVAVRDILKGINVDEARIPAILKVTDFDGIELDDDGKMKNAEEYTKKAKEEWSAFVTTNSTQGANTSTPPVSVSGAPKKMTKEEIFNIKDTAERQKAIAQNLDVFGYAAPKK